MLRLRLSQLLLLLWKLSTVYIIIIIILLYINLMNTYVGEFTFQELDQGRNLHKWSVFAIYLLYLLFWKRSNNFVISYLKKLEY